MLRLLSLFAALAASLVVVVPASADTTTSYQATFVEPYGGPNESPFSCLPGTSCGSANVSGFGHATDTVIVFNACGLGCHLRTVTFADGSTLVIRETPVGGFSSPGNAGSNGYVGFGFSGNPQRQDIIQEVLGGTGRFAGASGTGAGTVRVAGGVAIIHTSGTITLP